jgi:hypothetical protein
MQRKMPTAPDDEAALTADIIELARQYGRYGYRVASQRQRHGPEFVAEALRDWIASVGARTAYTMSRRKEPAIPAELLDQLLASSDAATALDRGGLLDSLKKALAERALNAEVDHHLGEEAQAGNSPQRLWPRDGRDRHRQDRH